MLKYLFLFLGAFTILSCGPSTAEIFEEDTNEIITYLEENNLIDIAQKTSTGFYYIIDQAGDQNNKPNLNSTITCAYKGFFPDGEVFDESDDATFVLGGTIEGWKQGIPLVGENGSIRLYIPSALCYGKSGRGSIPGNQVLFFEVDLIKVN